MVPESGATWNLHRVHWYFLRVDILLNSPPHEQCDEWYLLNMKSRQTLSDGNFLRKLLMPNIRRSMRQLYRAIMPYGDTHRDIHTRIPYFEPWQYNYIVIELTHL
jgi:hypothetical protein